MADKRPEDPIAVHLRRLGSLQGLRSIFTSAPGRDGVLHALSRNPRGSRWPLVMVLVLVVAAIAALAMPDRLPLPSSVQTPLVSLRTAIVRTVEGFFAKGRPS